MDSRRRTVFAAKSRVSDFSAGSQERPFASASRTASSSRPGSISLGSVSTKSRHPTDPALGPMPPSSGRARRGTLTDDETDRQGKKCAHGHIEDPQPAVSMENMLDGGSERQPDEAGGQRCEQEEAAEGGRLHDRAAGLAAEKGARSARTDEPGFRVDPLKDHGAHITDWPLSRDRFDAAGRRRDLP